MGACITTLRGQARITKTEVKGGQHGGGKRKRGGVMDCSRDVDGDGGDGNKNNKLLAWILCAILGREFQRSSIHSNGTWP